MAILDGDQINDSGGVVIPEEEVLLGVPLPLCILERELIRIGHVVPHPIVGDFQVFVVQAGNS